MKLITNRVANNWYEYSLTNQKGMTVSFLNYGGIITEMLVPDKNNRKENVVLSFKNYDDYLDNTDYLGALIGRVAGRIKHASFDLCGETYMITNNEQQHHIHGGNNGLHNTIWEVKPFKTDSSIGAILRYHSHDGDNGYPGNITIDVIYTLTDMNEFHIEYQATTDKSTILTLTNHTYFNLSGDLKETIKHHHVQIHSDRFLELDNELIPTGRWLAVHQSPFDFNHGQKLSRGINSVYSQNKLVGNGFDHYFQLKPDSSYSQVTIQERRSGRVMKIRTNQPGMVMYTGNGLARDDIYKTAHSKKYLGVCFETQAPAASLWQKDLPSIYLSPQETYSKKTVYQFDFATN